MKANKLSLLVVLPWLLTACANNGGFNAESALTAGAGVLQAVTLDEGQVKEAANQAAAEMDGKNKVLPDSDPRSQRLKRMVSQLKDTQGFNFKVYESQELNAFAMPDGTVRVYSGLLDAMPDDQVMAVLQHEIGHVKLKHSYEQMREQILTSTAFQTIASTGGTIGQLTGSQLGQLAYAFINARFSQGDELEADAYAVRALREAGHDPAAMKRAIQTLQAKYGAGGGFLSSHPSNDQRIRNIEKTMK